VFSGQLHFVLAREHVIGSLLEIRTRADFSGNAQRKVSQKLSPGSREAAARSALKVIGVYIMATIPQPHVSLKPNRGRTWKRLRRIQIVCELEAQFIPDADIARHLGLSVPALHHIKLCPEYQSLKISKQTNIMSVYEKLRMSAEDIKDEIEEMIPVALRNVKTALIDHNNPYHMKASMDMLDRHESTLKISRIKNEHDVSRIQDHSRENAKARELLEMLEGTAPSVLDVDATRPYDSNVGLLPADTNLPAISEVAPSEVPSEEESEINSQTFFDRDEANGPIN
jgi:hypothetical protein